MIKPPVEITKILNQLLIKCSKNAKHGPFLLSDIRKHETKYCNETSSDRDSITETQKG